MQGFLGGVLVGAAMLVGAGVYLSLTSPMARNPEVGSVTPVPASVEQASTDETVDKAGADADVVELAPRALDPEPVGDDNVTVLEETDKTPISRPELATDTNAITSPEISTDVAVNVAPVAPVEPVQPAALPTFPQHDVELVQVDQSPAQPSPEKAPEVAEIQPRQNDIPAPLSVPTAETELPEADTEVAALQPENAEPDFSAEQKEPEQQPVPETPDLPKVRELPQIGGDDAASTASGVGTPVVPLTERDDEPQQQSDGATAQEAAGPPIEEYAADFENPGGRPLMAIVLIDDIGSLGAEALADFPYPLTFAISPVDPEASEKMARYRTAGFEVMMMTDMPLEATAKDAEVSLAVWLETLPETVGILEGTLTGVQGNRDLAEQVAAIAGGTGRGVVMQDNGLNTAQKLAARNGVPSAVVFRDFDGAGQEPKVMRRFLDQAAFRAGQEGSVIMLGRVRPDTISALVLWGLQDRASRVSLAPVSAVLKSGAGG